ncbi:hypothetical protein GZH47_32255 (plasmid) [Paenibacillus rhizovicinus]|uniref:Uncharacterized protein n=1 Tax=Paenibacillus rhizovicinus TaxID=2704463 RepID=A0A6C0PAP2_9BACL|nr:hypothetical protein [Paenibacillus rhizovicinus]QHW35559.1 hypothetical protein GZH47_32255 [Paenibacillus rhizovicinus]
MSAQINVFPNKGLFATYEDKLNNVREMGKSIPVEDGIMEIVEAINHLPFFLTESSCEGRRGRRTREHLEHPFEYPYVGIGVLYNQTSWLEEFAVTIIRSYRDRVHLSIQAGRKPNEINVEVKPYRLSIKLDIYDLDALPELVVTIQEFGKNMPAAETLIESESKFQADELAKEARAYEYVEQLQRSVQAVTKEQIAEVLTAANLNVKSLGSVEERNGYPRAENITFETSKSFPVSDFLRLYQIVTGGNGLCFCHFYIEEDDNITTEIAIYVFDHSLLGVLKAFLQDWIQSPDGKLI